MANIVIYSFLSAYVVSFLFATKNATSRPSALGFFWGDRSLSPSLTTHLMLTNSFSLNGLLYQTWLGYSIGWWSLLIQAVWCGGFLLLSTQCKRLPEISGVGTMHGIIGSRFGVTAEKIAAICSVLGFTALIGWEVVVGSILLDIILSSATFFVAVTLGIVVAVVSALYTMLGGIRGDAQTNMVQNFIKISFLVTSFLYLCIVYDINNIKAFTESSSARSDFRSVVDVLSVSGLLTNLVFSLLWQSADMSVWQNISATEPLASKQRQALVSSAALAFLFPGVFGALLGMAIGQIQAQQPITDNNILGVFVLSLAENRYIAFMILTSFALAMLSTIDGYALATSQTVTWDIIFRSKIKRVLAGEGTRADNSEIVAFARVVILVCAIFGACGISYLVHGIGVSLFRLVYLVVIAQMVLAPVILTCIFTNYRFSQRFGWLPILAGLLSGFVSAALGLLTNNDDLFNAASIVGLVVCAFAILMVRVPKEIEGGENG